MTLAYWMLIAAAMLPYLTIALAKSAGGIDNRAPRPSLESLSGWRQRADWAHRNHFEAFNRREMSRHHRTNVRLNRVEGGTRSRVGWCR
jgi:hypothetical protein